MLKTRKEEAGEGLVSKMIYFSDPGRTVDQRGL